MELLCVLFAVAALFCGCAVLTLKCRVPAAVAPLTALSLIVAVLTLAAMAGVLYPAAWAVYALCLAGGVSANRRLRAQMTALAAKRGFRLCMPELWLCTDNAAMIGCQAYYEYLRGARAGSELNAWANMEISEVPFYGRA